MFTHTALPQQSGWFRQNSGTNQDIYSVFFFNPDTGIAVGTFSTILKTTNGGLNWVSKNAGVQSSLFIALCFINTNTGFVSGYDGDFVKTTDAGETWILFPQNRGCVYSFFFINQSTGFGVGRHNNIIKTTDTGNNWTSMSSYGDTNFTSIYFTNESVGFISCEQGSIFRTTNGGFTWSSQYNSSNYALWSITFINANTGFAAGQINYYDSALILKTTNSGQNWNIIVSGVGNNINCIKF
ncbi:MAG: WD40/YVTN/BNR-like repeat-containing protein, partial [Ignavibacteria bacterium]